MAWQSVQSVFVTQGIAGESMGEGLAVKLAASGLHNDVPTALLATVGDVDVFCVLATPDNFPRPTPSDLFSYTSQSTFPRASTITEDQNLIQSRTWYHVGPSMLGNPTLASGWKVQLHKGGAYHVPSGRFVDTATIRNAGAHVKVASGGLWTYAAANDASRVGYVREYNADDGSLVFVLGMGV
jgi:hypothetical protein